MTVGSGFAQVMNLMKSRSIYHRRDGMRNLSLRDFYCLLYF